MARKVSQEQIAAAAHRRLLRVSVYKKYTPQIAASMGIYDLLQAMPELLEGRRVSEVVRILMHTFDRDGVLGFKLTKRAIDSTVFQVNWDHSKGPAKGFKKKPEL